MSQDGAGYKDCKRVRKHIAWLLSIKVLEVASDMMLSISGWLVVLLRYSGWKKQ